MTTTYTDAQIEDSITWLSNQYTRHHEQEDADAREQLRSLLAERKAAIQPQDRVDRIAKLIADKCGNGMREKYEDVARKIVEAIQPKGGEVGYEMVDIFQAAADDYHHRNGGDVDRMHHWRMQVLYGIRAVIKVLPPQHVNGDDGDVRGFSREDILRVLDYANAPGMKCVTAEMTAMLQEFLTQYEEKLDTPEVIPGTLNALGTISIQPKDKQA